MNLFTPLYLRSLTLKNRIVVSPMQQYSAINGIPGNWHLVHLGSRAVGGAGLILTECTAVSPEGLATLNDVGLWNDEQQEAWKNIVDFVHEQDAKIGVQFWHSGGKGSLRHPNRRMKPLSAEEGGWTVKSSSATEINGVIPKELTIVEIHELTKKFAAAAVRAVEAGFDTIELHAGHGYLFHQFYSEVINKRQDEYGGSFENRIRFLVETVREIRKAIPEIMPLLVRISAVDYIDTPEGWTLEDSIALSSVLKENGVDYHSFRRRVYQREQKQSISRLPGTFCCCHKRKDRSSYRCGRHDHISTTGRRNHYLRKGRSGRDSQGTFTGSLFCDSCRQGTWSRN